MVITGNYNLKADSNWKLLQLQEVYLQCDTTLSPVTINLFEIAELNRFWNVKIYVSDYGNNSSTNNIVINSFVGDTIDESGLSQVTIENDGSSIVLQVVDETKWIASDSIIKGFVKSVTGLNTDNTDPENPVVKISVDNSTIIGDGTPGNPLVANVLSGTFTYGSFFDTSTQTSASNVPQAMRLNSVAVDETNNVSVVSDGTYKTRITPALTGIYNLAFSAQLDKSGGGGSDANVYIWLRHSVLGDVPNSSTRIQIKANQRYLVAAWNFFIKLNAGEYAQIMWAQDDNIVLHAENAQVAPPSAYNSPEIPSVILTVNRIG